MALPTRDSSLPDLSTLDSTAPDSPGPDLTAPDSPAPDSPAPDTTKLGTSKSGLLKAGLFKAVDWQRFPRDFLIIQIGFALFALSIAILIQANLGTSPWVMLTVALSDLTGLTKGTLTILTGIVVLGLALLMREPIGWGTLGNILFIGPWLDLFLLFIPSVTENLLLQVVMLLASIGILALGSAIYIGVNAGAGPRDSLMLAVDRTTPLSIGQARSGIELLVFVVGWLLGGPFGIGTIVVALLIGPAVQWSFKLLKVKTA